MRSIVTPHAVDPSHLEPLRGAEHRDEAALVREQNLATRLRRSRQRARCERARTNGRGCLKPLPASLVHAFLLTNDAAASTARHAEAAADERPSRPPVDLRARLDEFDRLRLHPLRERVAFVQSLLRGVLADILRDLHRAEVRTAHGTE